MQKGDVIVAENAECRKLYKIASGKCTMEVEVAPGRNEISNVLRVCLLLFGGEFELMSCRKTIYLARAHFYWAAKLKSVLLPKLILKYILLLYYHQ